jgi:hypothetical protein
VVLGILVLLDKAVFRFKNFLHGMRKQKLGMSYFRAIGFYLSN